MYSLTLNNQIEEIPSLAAFIEEVCEVAGASASVTMNMNLALEEAVTNVMLYAYPKGEQGTVTITAEVAQGTLTFVITDSGKAFDPTAQAEADVTLGVEERPIGGLGIFLVRQLMDRVGYERKDDCNVLTLVKQL